MNGITEFLPKHKETKQPLWDETPQGYVVFSNDAKITISKPRKNAKALTVSLENGPVYTLKKEQWAKITDYCRFLVLLKKRAGAAQIREILIDTPDKGRFFISEPNTGFVWLTDADQNMC
jgi:hypothetical protein